MTTGFLAAGRCFASSADATDVYFSSFPPGVTSNATSYWTYFEKAAGVWKVKSYSWSSTGVATLRFTVNAPTPTLAACEVDAAFFDGMTIGWGVVAAMVIAWGFRTMREQAR